MTHCIGIDPSYAKPIAYAYRADLRTEGTLGGRDGLAWVVGGVKPDRPNDWTPIFETAKRRGVECAIIEGGYVGPSPKVALKLAEVRGMLEIFARSAGLSTLAVAPATWQVAMLTVGGHRPRTHQEIVTTAIWVARNALDAEVRNDDQAVAVCLAEWAGAQMLKFERSGK